MRSETVKGQTRNLPAESCFVELCPTVQPVAAPVHKEAVHEHHDTTVVNLC